MRPSRRARNRRTGARPGHHGQRFGPLPGAGLGSTIEGHRPRFRGVVVPLDPVHGASTGGPRAVMRGGRGLAVALAIFIELGLGILIGSLCLFGAGLLRAAATDLGGRGSPRALAVGTPTIAVGRAGRSCVRGRGSRVARRGPTDRGPATGSCTRRDPRRHHRHDQSGARGLPTSTRPYRLPPPVDCAGPLGAGGWVVARTGIPLGVSYPVARPGGGGRRHPRQPPQPHDPGRGRAIARHGHEPFPG